MAEDTKTRDELAKERTHLANERTILSYLRTTLAFLLAGALILRLDHSLFATIVAYISIVIGIVVGIWGAKRFVQYKVKINNH